MIATGFKAIVGILSVLGAWLLVGAAWRRVFPGLPADEDVMSGRMGCLNCPCDTHCEQFGHPLGDADDALPRAPDSK